MNFDRRWIHLLRDFVAEFLLENERIFVTQKDFCNEKKKTLTTEKDFRNGKSAKIMLEPNPSRELDGEKLFSSRKYQVDYCNELRFVRQCR